MKAIGRGVHITDGPREEPMEPFVDRTQAGRALADLVRGYATEHPVVLALPRGGVPVGREVARALNAPLDVLIVRKLGCPGHSELGIGAVGERDEIVINHDLARHLGVSRPALEAVVAVERSEVDRRIRLYRDGRPPIPVAGRTVVVVDDGLVTGYTARAALQMVRARGAERVVLAVPVAPQLTVKELAPYADEIVCVIEPRHLVGVGAWYHDFHQLTDEEVRSTLAGATPPVSHAGELHVEDVVIPAGGRNLPGMLGVPEHAVGIVVFAHGSGSSRLSRRNVAVARTLNAAGFATLLFDLLTHAEANDRANVFDIGLLADRLVAATLWAHERDDVGELPLGYFGASTGAAAALLAASAIGGHVRAVVSRGGRPDLAGAHLSDVVSPTLLIVGALDRDVLAQNVAARRSMRCSSELAIVPGASHLFEEPGTLEAAGDLARRWFERYVANIRNVA